MWPGPGAFLAIGVGGQFEMYTRVGEVLGEVSAFPEPSETWGQDEPIFLMIGSGSLAGSQCLPQQ